MLRQKVFYSGDVQGVGFRQSVAYLAKGIPLDGWVRNLPDGRVELAVVGEPRVVHELLAKIQVETPGRISSVETQDWDSPKLTPGFRVRYDLNP